MDNINTVVVASVLGIGALICFSAYRNLSGVDRDNAMQEARSFARSMKLDTEAVECARIDSDGDGYVSCTIMTTANGRTELIPIECAGKFNLNEGCRLQRAYPSRGRR